MPILIPRKNEKENDFIQRCMGDAMMNKEYPDQKQRAGCPAFRDHRLSARREGII